MQKSFTQCAHCGLQFPRSADIPFINRSDGKAFHLKLFAKPETRSASSVGFPPEHVICIFEYSHDRVGTDSRFVVVIVQGRTDEIQPDELENVADKLAELLMTGEKPKAAYVINRGATLAGFPR